MTVWLLGFALICSWLAGMLLVGELRFLHRKTTHMSASLERLKAAVTAVETKVASLESQAGTPNGTPDSELDALSSKLEALVTPASPTAAPAPAV